MPSEAAEQQALFGWMKHMEQQYPVLGLAFAVPNGGKRDVVTAMQMKRTGAKKGVPDILMLAPMHGYCGLALELKITGNHATPEQQAWLQALRNQGYAAYVAYGWVQASEIILAYLEGKLEGIEDRLSKPPPKPKRSSASGTARQTRSKRPSDGAIPLLPPDLPL